MTEARFWSRSTSQRPSSLASYQQKLLRRHLMWGLGSRSHVCWTLWTPVASKMDVFLLFLKQNQENKIKLIWSNTSWLSLPIYQNLRAHSLTGSTEGTLALSKCLLPSCSLTGVELIVSSNLKQIYWSCLDVPLEVSISKWLGSMAYFTYFPKWGSYIGVITNPLIRSPLILTNFQQGTS